MPERRIFNLGKNIAYLALTTAIIGTALGAEGNMRPLDNRKMPAVSLSEYRDAVRSQYGKNVLADAAAVATFPGRKLAESIHEYASEPSQQ